jgi:FkbM family methyltransferase
VVEPLMLRLLARPGVPARVEAERHGARFSFDLRDYVQRKLYCHAHQSPELAYVARACRPGDTVVDVGANVGAFTMVAARATAPGGEVHALEPVPATLRALERNRELNGFTNVRTAGLALSDGEGTLQLGVEAAGHGSGGYTSGGALETVTVRSSTLDAFAQATLGDSPVRLLKIDVEGHEPEVLAGGGSFLRAPNRPDIVLVEVSETALADSGSSGAELTRSLTESGYELFTARAGGRLRRYRPMSPRRAAWAARYVAAPPPGGWNRVRALYWSHRVLEEVVGLRADRRDLTAAGRRDRAPATAGAQAPD